MTSNPVYEDYGVHYDALWTPLPKRWQKARMRLIRKALPNLRSVCELGCGTARTAVEFASEGLRVYGVDLSPSMLKSARKRIQKAGVRVHLIRGDMRTFRLPQQVDLVSSEWGVVNHLPRKRELVRVANTVARALRPGGYFLFDINRKRLFEKVWAGMEMRETQGYVHVQEGGWDARRGKGWVKMIWFVPRGNGTWERNQQSAEEVHWTTTEIRRALRRAGFDRIRAFDYMSVVSKSRAQAKLQGLKTMFLARKKPQGPS
jgi:SAM-dependent methyltransferase